MAIGNEFDEVIIDGSEEMYQVSRCSSQTHGKIKKGINGGSESKLELSNEGYLRYKYSFKNMVVQDAWRLE